MKRLYEYSVKRTYVGACEAGEVYASNPSSASKYIKLLELHEDDQENIVILMLNNKNLVLGASRICRGLVNKCHAHPREIFRPAVIAHAVKIILVHNHPSGNTYPSGEDIELTKNIIASGDVLGIPVVDHVIVGSERGEYVSRSMRAMNDVRFK